MGDINLFTKKEKEFKTSTQTVRTYSHDIRLEFGIEKGAMLIMRSGENTK